LRSVGKSLKPFEIKGLLKKESAQPLYQNGCADMDLLHCFDRISSRGVHRLFRGVQTGARGVHFPKGVQSER
jgi:hypothetical protein